MAIETIANYAKELMEPIKHYGKAALDSINPSSYIKSAFADYDAYKGQYFCNPNNLSLEKADYIKDVDKINFLIKSHLNAFPNASMEEKSGFITPYLEEVGRKAACLKEAFDVNPDSVAQFSPEAQKIFYANMEKLYDVAPTLVKYATVPEFGGTLNNLYSHVLVGVDTLQSKVAGVASHGPEAGAILGIVLGGLGLGTYLYNRKHKDKDSRLFYKE